MVIDASNNFWPYSEYSNFLETDDFVWHYQLIGKPGNPIMLLIHGAGASSHSWASLIPKLQEFQILAVDLPGHRFSKIKKGIRPQHDIIVRDLVVLFNALKINSTLALIGAIVAEFFGTPIVGMGFRISTEIGRMNVDVVWATIAVAALSGSFFYALLAFLERQFTGWHPSFRVG